MSHPARPAAPAPQGPPSPADLSRIPTAASIAPSDNSTSIVTAAPLGPQITLGRVPVTAHRDLVYATRDTAAGRVELLLDLLVPDTAKRGGRNGTGETGRTSGTGETSEPGGKVPLVVYLPGGGFVVCPKEANPQQRAYVAEAGYAVASIQYRTIANGATYRDGVADVKSAVRFLRAHAARYGIDPERVAVWGESAGGYLAAMTGATNGDPAFDTPDHAEQSSAVAAVIDQFGPSNLATAAADFDPAFQEAYARPGTPTAAYVFGPGSGKALADDPAAIAQADPATHISPATPLFLFFHGSRDNVISPSQTLLLHTALREQGVSSTRYVLEGAGHGPLAAMLGDPDGALPWSAEPTMDRITAFLATLGR